MKSSRLLGRARAPAQDRDRAQALLAQLGLVRERAQASAKMLLVLFVPLS
jgi:hypothetical protein